MQELPDETRQHLKRRGLIAGAAALTAGLLARQTTQPVSADNGQPVYLGQDNTATLTTSITAGSAGLGTAFTVNNSAGTMGISANGSTTGIVGTGMTGISGSGTSNANNAIGVYGYVDGNMSNTTGVQGVNNNIATPGPNSSTGAVAVLGSIPSSSNVNNGIAVRGVNTATGTGGIGVSGQCDAATGTGVQGISASGVGVLGTVPTGTAANTVAVKGVNASSGANVVGVLGQSDVSSGIGVQGASASGVAISGTSTAGTGVRGTGNPGLSGIATSSVTNAIAVNGSVSGTAGGTVAVKGLNSATGSNNTGVLGQCDVSGSTGVSGFSANGFPVSGTISGSANNNAAVTGYGTAGPGVQGQSTGGYGLVGTTFAADGTHAGLIGTVQPGGNAIGVRGSVPSGATGFAGVFDGNVTINGTLTLNGSKNAYVPFPDGTHRLLYCVEAPEAWFEDFGTSTLVNGKAIVTLDSGFAAVVDTTLMRVFPVPEGDCKGLFIASKSATGFTVQELQGGTSNVPFSYRVVAKRKDIASPRLAKFTPPPPPTLPKVFTPPSST